MHNQLAFDGNRLRFVVIEIDSTTEATCRRLAGDGQNIMAPEYGHLDWLLILFLPELYRPPWRVLLGAAFVFWSRYCNLWSVADQTLPRLRESFSSWCNSNSGRVGEVSVKRTRRSVRVHSVSRVRLARATWSAFDSRTGGGSGHDLVRCRAFAAGR